MAVLYCFLNGEVRSELSRVIRTRKWPRVQGRWGQRPSTHSSSTCSCNGAKIGKGHEGFRRWTRPWACFFHDRDAHRSTHSMASTQGVFCSSKNGQSPFIIRSMCDVAKECRKILSFVQFLRTLFIGKNL